MAAAHSARRSTRTTTRIGSRRWLGALAVVVLCLPFVTVPTAMAQTAEPPQLQVHLEPPGITGYGFDATATSVVVTLDSGDDGAVDHTWTIPDDFLDGGAQWMDGSFDLWAPFHEGDTPVLIEPDDRVTITDGTTTNEHVVIDLYVDPMVAGSAVITGTAPAGTQIGVFSDSYADEQGPPVRWDVADAGGAWSVDFDTVPDETIGEYGQITAFRSGDATMAMAVDPEATDPGSNDNTTYHRWIANPTFSVETPSMVWSSSSDGLTVDDTVTITVDSDVSDGVVDHVQTATVTDEGWGPQFWVELAHEFVPGDTIVVELSDGTSKTLIVAPLTVDTVDAASNTVVGTAPAGATVEVDVGDESTGAHRTVDADGSGTWQADLTPTTDDDPTWEGLADGMGGSAQVFDDDGDSTHRGICVGDCGGGYEPGPPRFEVDPLEGTIHGQDWLDATEVTIAVDDPATPESPDHAGTVPVEYWGEEEPASFSFYLDPTEEPIEPGFVITVTDDDPEASTTKTHVVTALIITDADVEADTITGRAASGTPVQVGGGHEQAGGDVETTTQPDGVWVADLSGAFDLEHGMHGYAAQQDDDGDATVGEWQTPPPGLWSEPYDDIVVLEWDDAGVTFDVAITGLGDGSDWDTTAVTEQFGRHFWEHGLYLDLGAEGLDVVAGTTVELADPATGEVVRSLTVSPLTVTSFDAGAGAVHGEASAGAHVELMLHNSTGWAWRATTADAQGHWTLHPGIDVATTGEEGDGVVADIGHRFEVSFHVDEPDADGDRTRVDFEEYRMGGATALVDDDAVVGQRWTGLFDVTVTVYDASDTVLFSQGGYDTSRDPGAPVDVAGMLLPSTGDRYTVIELAGVFDLRPGQRVELTDSIYTTEIVLPELTVTEVDLATDTLSGSGPADEPVFVPALGADGWPVSWRVTCTDAAGAWAVDFGTEVEEPVYLDCLDPETPISSGEVGFTASIDLSHDTVTGGLALVTDSHDPFGTVPDDDDAAGVTWTTHLTELAATPTVAEVDVDAVTFTARITGTDPTPDDERLVRAEVDWGDGTTSVLDTDELPAATDDGDVALSFEHTFATPGVYTQALTATFADGHTEVEAREYVVVYDPAAGFVTGGGWIDSPEGALVGAPDASGRATFGFMARYRRGASVPDGRTVFRFRAGDLDLHSTSYDWLVVTGNDVARFKGSAEVNGVDGYRFLIWAGDGTGDGGTDTFRIRIWLEEDGEEIYDNGMHQVIGGGSIRVHTGR